MVPISQRVHILDACSPVTSKPRGMPEISQTAEPGLPHVQRHGGWFCFAERPKFAIRV